MNTRNNFLIGIIWLMAVCMAFALVTASLYFGVPDALANSMGQNRFNAFGLLIHLMHLFPSAVVLWCLPLSTRAKLISILLFLIAFFPITVFYAFGAAIYFSGVHP